MPDPLEQACGEMWDRLAELHREGKVVVVNFPRRFGMSASMNLSPLMAGAVTLASTREPMYQVIEPDPALTEACKVGNRGMLWHEKASS
jgi:hypothetical protein